MTITKIVQSTSGLFVCITSCLLGLPGLLLKSPCEKKPDQNQNRTMYHFSPTRTTSVEKTLLLNHYKSTVSVKNSCECQKFWFSFYFTFGSVSHFYICSVFVLTLFLLLFIYLYILFNAMFCSSIPTKFPIS